jgi:primosomal protein N' (replication factor Y)
MALAPGDFVTVPLGRAERTGVVWALQDWPPEGIALKPVIAVRPVVPLPEVLRRFIDWVADYTLSPKGAVLRMAMSVPAALEPERRRQGVRRGQGEPERLTPARRRVLDVAADGLVRSVTGLAREAAVSPSVVRGLVKTGVLARAGLPAFAGFARPDPEKPGPEMSAEQARAVAMLQKQMQPAAGFSAALLDGVTGSGKTEVYFEAVSAALRAGAQVLVLLPEIALTGSFVERFEARFGARPSEWHSGLGARARERVWRAVASGGARVVIGARSALFLPFAELGLIVVDEEHESAFKQEDGVIYHGRDMAVVRASLGRFPVILSSATPSLESMHNAMSGKYHHIRLHERHGGAALPDISVIDMRRHPPPRGRWLSPEMVSAVGETLACGEQVLLFLNRRGYAPLTLCRACGHRMECPHCSAWLVEHRHRGTLMCHHCGFEGPVPAACPSCGAADQMVACGPGVERIAAEAAADFPGARLAVLSSDVLDSLEHMRGVFAAIEAGEIDLIVGTQLVAKGHHFPALTLVGVVDADLGLAHGDMRAAEHTYQLLHQVAGRAGRAERKGRALLQSYQPASPVIRALASGERDAFFTYEMAMRKTAALPPFGRLAAVIISGPDEATTRHFADGLARNLPEDEAVRVLGPATAPLAMIRGRFRFRFLLKAARHRQLHSYLHGWLDRVRPGGGIKLRIDMDPQSFL